MLSAAHLLAETDVAEIFGVVSSANATIAAEQIIVIVKIIDNSFSLCCPPNSLFPHNLFRL